MQRDPELKALIVQGWMLLLGIFWFFRFWLVREEAIWLFKLDVYRGDETASLVDVSLGRDGMVYLFMAFWLFTVYGNLIVRFRKKRKGVREEGNGKA